MPSPLKKVLNSDQIRKVDKFSVVQMEIQSIDLMEMASMAFVNAIKKKIKKRDKIIAVCGNGNNGGDGFAVTRILLELGYNIDCFNIDNASQQSEDCMHNFKRVDNVKTIKSTEDIPDFNQYDFCIDAIFGSGLTRPIEGLLAEIIVALNSAKLKVFAIDLPSGMYCDKIPDSDIVVKANLTISFQRPKLSFFFPEWGEYLKKWKVVNIGLDEKFIQSLDSPFYVLDKKVKKYIQKRKRFSHKGTYGHALLIVGSYGKMGAAVLSSKACLRSGVGLLTTHIPKCGYTIMQTTVSEAMCFMDNNEHYLSNYPKISPYTTIGFGPGIGITPETKTMIEDLLSSVIKPIVIDADGLNILSENKELFSRIQEGSILTPHPKEFERMVGNWKNSEERLLKQKSFSIKYKCIIVLKDAYTSISNTHGDLYFNTSGNPGMATAGSGDVLTGIIVGLLAQGYSPLESALIGVFYHGKAGDKAKKKKGENALLASDIIEALRIE